MEHGILTTRFTDDTYTEMVRWIETNQYTGCIYNLKNRISDRNLYDKPYFVLEMNNTTNTVMGIGVIHNHVSYKENVYSNPYLNRYTYKGKHRITIIKDELSEKDRLYLETNIERLLFYGKGHMKRGQSMTHFPKHKITTKHMEFLNKLVYGT
jgi:hypothetical protein|tara:strand:+ start:77 stop:535 length:459 start_codon:yes stop_codon:yes gene_type:complete